MGCIYKISNLQNGMIYIGQTINIKRRIKEYKYKSRNLESKSKYKIMEEINKYGFENFSFDVIEDNIEDKDLDEREIFWINKLESRNPHIGYNSKEGGRGGKMIQDSIHKMSDSSRKFRHTEEEKLKRSKPIFVYENGKLRPYISAKIYADNYSVDKSTISATIRRGIKFHGNYIFYQNKDERMSIVLNLIDKKLKKNKVCRKSLNEYLSVYMMLFNDFDIESVETNL